MGTFDVPIQVADLDGQHFEEIEALVDTGATFTVVPRAILRNLQIDPTDSKPFMYASGERVLSWIWLKSEFASRTERL